MKRVIIESPLAHDNPDEIRVNVAYARACMRDAIDRGEAPLASHLLYPQRGILNDHDPDERELGIRLGHCWIEDADLVAVYTDRGISLGMHLGIDKALLSGVRVEMRALNMNGAHGTLGNA